MFGFMYHTWRTASPEITGSLPYCKLQFSVKNVSSQASASRLLLPVWNYEVKEMSVIKWVSPSSERKYPSMCFDDLHRAAKPQSPFYRSQYLKTWHQFLADIAQIIHIDGSLQPF